MRPPGAALAAGAGVHPFALGEGELSADPRYEFTRREYAPVASRQLVFGLHVHVRVTGAERALGVYNALRSYLPTLAALAANAPFHAGADSGFASIRPQISDLLPRQGIPPAFATLDEWAAALTFGRASGAFETRRLVVGAAPASGAGHGRGASARPADDRGGDSRRGCGRSLPRGSPRGADRCRATRCPAIPRGRYAENRWLAARHGLGGDLLNLDTGERVPARETVLELIESLDACRGPAGLLRPSSRPRRGWRGATGRSANFRRGAPTWP